MQRLDDELIVEDEVVRIVLKRDRLEEVARIGTKTGVVLRQLGVAHDVLNGGQSPVGDVFVERHAAMAGVAPEDARTQHHVVVAARYHARHRGHEPRRILVVWMDHDHHVGTGCKGFAIARLLIAAVTTVLGVHEGVQPELASESGGVVGRAIVGENYRIDHIVW